MLGVPAGSPKPEAAFAFIRYMQSKMVQERLVNQLGWPSIRPDVYGKVAPWLRPQFEAVRQAMTHGVLRKNVPYWAEFQKLINEAFTRIVVRGEEVEPTLAEYRRAMDKVRARYGAR